MRNIQIALLGSSTIAREGLRRILEDKEFEVVRSWSDPACPLDLEAPTYEYSFIILVDQSCAEYARDEVQEILDNIPDAKLVYLAEKFDLNSMITAFNLGAQGYIIKDIGWESLVGSLRLIALGEKVLPGQLLEELPKTLFATGGVASIKPDPRKTLSARELEILRYMAAGFPNKVIARRLDLGDATVKVHVKSILRKLNVSNRTQAAVLAFNSGLELPLQDADLSEMEDSVIESAKGWKQLANVA